MKSTDNGRSKFNTGANQPDQTRRQPAAGTPQGSQLNTAMNDSLAHTRDEAIRDSRSEASLTGRDVPTKSGFQGVEQNAPRKGTSSGTYGKGGVSPK